MIGIDPGKKGAIACLDHGGGLCWVKDTPLIGAKRPEYDGALMREILLSPEALSEEVRVYIERQASMPDQSSTSTFSQGEGFGLWKGLLLALQIPFEIVRSQEWTKAIYKGMPRGLGKRRGVLAVQQMWPKQVQLFRGPRGGERDDRCDAALIAEYGRRQFYGKT